MAGLFGKVAAFAASPQGRRAIDKARTAARDPRNREKLGKMTSRFTNKGGPGAQPPR